MPSVTYDSQSFLLDGRRIWLVSASVQYARIARDQWADRIHAAKLAGFNTIETRVIWARHEARPGHLDFSGENDVRSFVKLAGSMGMHAVLRPGPYVGAELDLGGIPAWVLELPGVQLRAGNGPFLEACSRYLTAVSEQVRDLQVTSVGQGGPILLVQNEQSWTCGSDEAAASYLVELNRYLREGGITVPIVDANSLWQGVEGEIDCWSGSEQLLSAMRQFATVRPNHPRVVIDFAAGRATVWGEKPDGAARVGGLELERRLAEVLAGGGQFNVSPFHGGTNFGFSGGRLARGLGEFVTASHDQGAPLSEDGSFGETFHAVRRIATFASRFGRVLANRNAQYVPVALDPSPVHARSGGGERNGKGAAPGVSVVHSTGTQGSVAFVFADREGGGSQTANLMLPDGTALPVDLGDRLVSWCVFDVHIGGRASLDYCNLSAFATVGRVFVCFGPAGTRGVLAVNGSPIEVMVPSGKAPEVVELEGITVVVCSVEQIETAYASDSAVYVGVLGLTADGRPVVGPHTSGKTYTRIDGEGVVTHGPTGAVGGVPSVARLHAAAHEGVKLGAWTAASMSEYLDGTSARYASIAGPADLGSLGSPYGYGWYRILASGAAGSARRVMTSVPTGGDRLHVFQGGKCVGLVGAGPGAEAEAGVSLKKGSAVVVLAENFGRVSGGACLGEKKGLCGHLLETGPVRLGKPKLVTGQPIDVLGFRTPLWEVREGDVTLVERVTWAMSSKPKGSLIMWFDGDGAGVSAGLPVRGLVVVNDKPVAYVDRSGPRCVVIDEEEFGRGKTVIQLALMGDVVTTDGLVESIGSVEDVLKSVGDSVRFSEVRGEATEKAEWAFAKWEVPPASAFGTPGKGVKVPRPGAGAGPTWWRSHFAYAPTTTPLYLELNGLTKGQVYVNGRHLGRYFASTPGGKVVGPQTRMFVPGPWLHAGENEVVVFDEHSSNPSHVKLSWGAGVPVTAKV